MIRRVGENMLQSADDHQSGKHVTRYTPLDENRSNKKNIPKSFGTQKYMNVCSLH